MYNILQIKANNIVNELRKRYGGQIEWMIRNKQIVIVNDCIPDNAELSNHEIRFFNVKTNEQCHAQRDGDCIWRFCPQEINRKSHCPIDCYFEED